MPGQKNLAIIGGGPKAAAIAAKAWCLREAGYSVTVTVFEKNEIGAAWKGGHGYTDGAQRLCTPAERDLGFPYANPFAPEVAPFMQARFSWMAYKLSKPSGPGSYADWISRGCKSPTHAEFADYLSFAVSEAEAEILAGEVEFLVSGDNGWTVVQRRPSGTYRLASGFHGVVVTGPGPALSKFRKPAHNRVVDGDSFWRHRDRLLRHANKSEASIAIIGGGGTAAAIAAWLVRNHCRPKIKLLSNQATLFTRTANFFENRMFDDNALWQSLGKREREEFATRLNRGVVWETVTDLLSDAPQLQILSGSATAVTHHRGRAPDDFTVDYEPAVGTASTDAGVVIDASGFDPWWFIDLLDPRLAQSMRKRELRLRRSMREDLSFRMRGPRLHAPMLSQTAGPGFMSLMALGAMSDRILSPYV